MFSIEARRCPHGLQFDDDCADCLIQDLEEQLETAKDERAVVDKALHDRRLELEALRSAKSDEEFKVKCMEEQLEQLNKRIEELQNNRDSHSRFSPYI